MPSALGMGPGPTPDAGRKVPTALLLGGHCLCASGFCSCQVGTIRTQYCWEFSGLLQKAWVWQEG